MRKQRDQERRIQTQNVRTLGGKWNLNATVVTIEQNI